MEMGIGSDIWLSRYQQTEKTSKTERLQNQLQGVSSENSTDEEMMEVCKEFEAYLVERVMKQMKEAMTSNEEEKGEYTTYFGDMMYQEYATRIAENGELGLARQLYESMKQNTVSPVQDKIRNVTEAAGAAQTAQAVSVEKE